MEGIRVVHAAAPSAHRDVAWCVDANEPVLLLDATASWSIQAELTRTPTVSPQPRGWPPSGESASLRWLSAAAAAVSDPAPSIDLDALAQSFGSRSAMVELPFAAEYGAARRRATTMRAYLDAWRIAHSDAASPMLRRNLGYLKDFHLHLGVAAAAVAPKVVGLGSGGAVKDTARLAPGYTPPPAFRDDWLNSWAARFTPDDFKFLYLGPGGSATAAHHDVVCSCSWSAQLSGSKRWRMRPSVGVGDWRTVIQPPRSLIFVPSGFEHDVLNLTASLSVNHNWFGAAAAPRCWAFLRSEAQIIEREFAQFKRAMDAEGDGVWTQRVADVERINSGLSRRQFAELLLLQAELAVESSAASGGGEVGVGHGGGGSGDDCGVGGGEGSCGCIGGRGDGCCCFAQERGAIVATAILREMCGAQHAPFLTPALLLRMRAVVGIAPV